MRLASSALCACLLLPLTGSPSLKVEPAIIPDWSGLQSRLREANRIQAGSRPADALLIYQGIRNSAVDAAAWPIRTRAIWGIGACSFLLRQYREALDAYWQARRIYELHHEADLVADLDANLSSLYRHLGDEDAALAALDRSLACTTDPRGRRRRLLVQRAAMHADRGEATAAEQFFREGAEESAKAGDWRLASNAWDQLGRMHLLDGRLADASTSLQKGYEIRKVHRIPVLFVSLQNLAVLRLEQGRFRQAARLFDEAAWTGGGSTPQWYFYEARARLRMRQGKHAAADADLRVSLHLAKDYMASAPNGGPARRAAARTVRRAFDSFITFQARSYLTHHNPAGMEAAFDAADEYRSWVLQAELARKPLHPDRHRAYSDLLDQLRSTELEMLLDPNGPAALKLAGIRERLMLYEAAAPWPAAQSWHGRLAATQKYLSGLAEPTALLLFHTADSASFLWAVTSRDVELIPLPSRSQLAAAAAAFRTGLLENNVEDRGRRLSRILLGRLPSQIRDVRSWLLSLDDGLYDVPFAGLAFPAGERYRPLVVSHALRQVPAAASLVVRAEPAPSGQEDFVGIGDPVYNLADERRLNALARFFLRVSVARPHSIDLNRLPGSGREVRNCLKEWGGNGYVITGPNVSRSSVLDAVDREPAVIHFATHVVRGEGERTNAMLALGITAAGDPEFLGSEEIAARQCRAGLVVLSGCASGRGWVSPGAGLMGLARGWLLAGTRNILATHWATADDSGLLLQRFYHHYRRLPRGGSVSPGFLLAEALRRAQLEAWTAGGGIGQYRSWSGYFIMGRP